MSVAQGAVKKAAKGKPRRSAKKPTESVPTDTGKGASKGV